MNAEYPILQRFCYWLNGLHLYRVSAGIRWLAFCVGGKRIIEERYANPEGVGGYISSFRWGHACLAFRRGDGTLQFRW